MTVAVVFASRRTADHGDEYGRMAAEMEALVREQPGFLRLASVRDPVSREGITVAWFRDEEAVRQWREHAAHLVAQQRGRADFYEEYEVTVATVEREYRWQR